MINERRALGDPTAFGPRFMQSFLEQQWRLHN